MAQSVVDNREYEQVQANAGAAIFEKVVSSEWDYRHDYLTTCSWAKRFNEPFLDFGCGTGLASAVYERMGRQVVGFDASRGMLQFARRRCHTLVLADALHLPFRDKVFSTTCVIGVLHHILDLDGAFAEIARCTKEVICINEPTPKPSYHLAMRFILLAAYGVSIIRKLIRLLTKNSVEKGEYRSRYERPLDPKMLIQLCNKYGFEIHQVRYFNHIPLLQKFLGERNRARLFAKLVSSKYGTDVEVIAYRPRL